MTSGEIRRVGQLNDFPEDSIILELGHYIFISGPFEVRMTIVLCSTGMQVVATSRLAPYTRI